ncbi:MAG: undecaprenyl-diphosphate phosphatase [Saprospiraceae bacterium]|nr:undecaprenyl-diphosphate phosphatase [Saprospiraceae bacterium]
MDILKALLLGIVQGLTEFLPVSSSGHIELGKAILNMNIEDDLAFSLIVHLATVLSTILVFRKDIGFLFKELFKFEWNEHTRFISYILISMIPIAILGLCFEAQIAALFTGNLTLVGISLLVTGGLLLSTTLFKSNTGELTFGKAFLIGLAQAAAIIPGISRSGATISTALNLGISKEQAARFSFLMVLLPIIGASLLQIKEIMEAPSLSVDAGILGVGFLGAFASGVAACTLMLNIVKKGKISYFAYYCFVVGILAIIFA